MTGVSQFLTSHSLDPFLIGLIGGALAVWLIRVQIRKSRAGGNVFVNDGASNPPSAKPVGSPVSTKTSFHFRIKINGADHSLPDEVTTSVRTALKSGNKAEAIRLLQQALTLESGTATRIVDALEKTNL